MPRFEGIETIVSGISPRTHLRLELVPRFEGIETLKYVFRGELYPRWLGLCGLDLRIVINGRIMQPGDVFDKRFQFMSEGRLEPDGTEAEGSLVTNANQLGRLE